MASEYRDKSGCQYCDGYCHGGCRENQGTLLNCIRSLFNIDGYLLPELSDDQQREFVRDPVRYFMRTDNAQQTAIFREVAKRQQVSA